MQKLHSCRCCAGGHPCCCRLPAHAATRPRALERAVARFNGQWRYKVQERMLSAEARVAQLTQELEEMRMRMSQQASFVTCITTSNGLKEPEFSLSLAI